MILSVDGVHKYYLQGHERLHILRGTCLRIDSPRSVAIMGSSGCGKSTLISLLAGLDSPDGGKITVLGRNINELTGADLTSFRARHIGIIFQKFHLLNHLTALENIRLPLDLNRVSSPDQVARNVLDRIGLGDRANHFPEQLSRGECQRVAMGRVLAMKPEILLADEPTGSLDVKTGQEVMAMLFHLVEIDKITLIMATHDPKVASMCDQKMFMAGGLLRENSAT